MSHTIEFPVPGYYKAVLICNGDLSGTVHVRMWKDGFDFHQDRAPDVDCELPDGALTGIVRAYFYRVLPPLAETWIPKVIDWLIPSVRGAAKDD